MSRQCVCVYNLLRTAWIIYVLHSSQHPTAHVRDARCTLIGNSTMIIIIIIIKDMYDAPDLSKNMTVLDVCNSRAIINKIHQHTHTHTPRHRKGKHVIYLYTYMYTIETCVVK